MPLSYTLGRVFDLVAAVLFSSAISNVIDQGHERLNFNFDWYIVCKPEEWQYKHQTFVETHNIKYYDCNGKLLLMGSEGLCFILWQIANCLDLPRKHKDGSMLTHFLDAYFTSYDPESIEDIRLTGFAQWYRHIPTWVSRTADAMRALRDVQMHGSLVDAVVMALR